MNNDKKGVCHKCDKRYLGCHSTCEDYLEWRQQFEEEKEYIRTQRKRDMETMMYAKESIARERKKRGSYKK